MENHTQGIQKCVHILPKFQGKAKVVFYFQLINLCNSVGLAVSFSFLDISIMSLLPSFQGKT
jgi:hypothetical protein